MVLNAGGHNMRKITRTTYVDDEGFTHEFEPINDEVEIIKKGNHFYAFYLAQDDGYESPDAWGGDSIFLVNYHRDFWVENKKVIDKHDVIDWYRGEEIEQEKDYKIFMLSCLVHSGVWLSLGRDFPCDPGGWDTSHVGVVLVSKKDFKTEEKQREAAQAIVDEWTMCLSGDVYGVIWEKFDKDKNLIDCESVWGYYGHKNALGELQNQKEYIEKQEEAA